MGTPRVSRAVQVTIYDCGQDRFMVALKTKWWQGQHTVDRRLARVRSVGPVDPCPDGVTPEVWWAYSALRRAVTEQRAVHRDGGSY